MEAEEEDSIISMAVATTTTVDGIYVYIFYMYQATATGEGGGLGRRFRESKARYCGECVSACMLSAAPPTPSVNFIALYTCTCSRGRFSPGGCLVLVIFGLVIGFVLALAFSLSFGTEPNQISSTETYTLTDNRLIAYKGDFCQDLRTTSTEQPNNLEASASLYFFKSRPPLTDRESFNVSESAQLNSNWNYHNWNFYLNAGSNTSLRVCYQLDSIHRDVKYLLIKGTNKFNQWLDDTSDSKAIYSSKLTEQCQTFTHQLKADNMYYFVFYLNSLRTTNIHVDFQFDRTLYHIQRDLVVSSCSFPLDGYSSCSLSAPMYSGYIGLLALNASFPVDHSDDEGTIHIGCQPRAWLYAVIVLAVVFFVAGAAFCVVFTCKLVISGKKKTTSSEFVNRSTDTTSSRVTTAFMNPSTAGYSSLPDYGSTPSAPPPPCTK